MAKIALNLDRMSVNDKIEKGRAVLTAAGTTDGIAILGTPAPAEVAAVLAKTDALETARDKKATADSIAKAATQVQTAAEAAFDLVLGDYGRVAQNKTGGEPTKITTLALEIAGAGATHGPIAAPVNVLASMSDMPGHVDVMWDPVRGTKMYVVQVCADPPVEANWRQAGMNSKSSFTVTGLTSGTKYWFRVAAKGTGPEQSPWSDPAEKMSP